MKQNLKYPIILAAGMLFCLQSRSFDIHTTSSNKDSEDSSLEKPFERVKKWMNLSIATPAMIETEFKIAILSTWGGGTLYSIAISRESYDQEKITKAAYVSYLTVPSAQRKSDSGIMIQVGPLPSTKLEAVIKEARSLLTAELKQKDDKGFPHENARKESLCLLVLKDGEKESKIGINNSGSVEDWNSVDSLCKQVVDLIQDNAPKTSLAPLLRKDSRER